MLQAASCKQLTSQQTTQVPRSLFWMEEVEIFRHVYKEEEDNGGSHNW
jgi:hypothetical protein